MAESDGELVLAIAGHDIFFLVQPFEGDDVDTHLGSSGGIVDVATNGLEADVRGRTTIRLENGSGCKLDDGGDSMTEIMSKTKSEIEIERDGKELKTTKILISNLLNLIFIY